MVRRKGRPRRLANTLWGPPADRKWLVKYVDLISLDNTHTPALKRLTPKILPSY